MAQDEVAQFSEPIAAYMAGLPEVNVAYARHFGKLDNTTQATFDSLTSNGFTLTCVTEDAARVQVFIAWPNAPLTERAQIRATLTDMATEAEKALGLPSSMHGPPPIAAMMRAAAAESAARGQDAGVSAGFGAAADDSAADDVFVHADLHLQVPIVVGMALTWFLTEPRPDVPIASSLQAALGLPIIHTIWRVACFLHISEAAAAALLCMKRAYSPANTLRWTVSTFFFGFASMMKLVPLGKTKKQ